MTSLTQPSYRDDTAWMASELELDFFKRLRLCLAPHTLITL